VSPSASDPPQTWGAVDDAALFALDAGGADRTAPPLGSSAMSLPKSAGEPGVAEASIASNRALIVGSASAALTSRLSPSTMSFGVFLGAPRPHQ